MGFIENHTAADFGDLVQRTVGQVVVSDLYSDYSGLIVYFIDLSA